MKKLFVVCISVLFLSACSAKFAYNNADWLIDWYIDDYIDFTDEQEQMFDIYFAEWMAWHKQQELPKYEQQLRRFITDVSSGNIDYASLTQHQDELKAHWVEIRTHLAPDLAELAATMSDEQVTRFFVELEKENQKEDEALEELAEMPLKKRIKRWNKNRRKNLSRWIGKLSDEQKQLIASYEGKFKPSRALWLQYQRDYQQALRVVFITQGRSEAFKQALQQLIVEPEKYRSDSLHEVSEHNAHMSKQYLVEVLETLSDKQRQKMIEETGEIQQDIISLHSN